MKIFASQSPLLMPIHTVHILEILSYAPLKRLQNQSVCTNFRSSVPKMSQEVRFTPKTGGNVRLSGVFCGDEDGMGIGTWGSLIKDEGSAMIAQLCGDDGSRL
jgi:hypothetical protein